MGYTARYDVDPLDGRTLEEFEAMEAEVASCDARHLGYFRSLAAFDTAVDALAEQGLSLDANHYYDAGEVEIFSLWAYPPRMAPPSDRAALESRRT